MFFTKPVIAFLAFLEFLRGSIFTTKVTVTILLSICSEDCHSFKTLSIKQLKTGYTLSVYFTRCANLARLHTRKDWFTLSLLAVSLSAGRSGWEAVNKKLAHR